MQVFKHRYKIILVSLVLLMLFCIPNASENLNTDTVNREINCDINNATPGMSATLPEIQDTKSQIASIHAFQGFTQNAGQIPDTNVRYSFSSDSSSISFGVSSIEIVQQSAEQNQQRLFLEQTFLGAYAVEPISVGQYSHANNYYFGSESYLNVHSYHEIWYFNLYDGIDLRYYVVNDAMKYEFLVHPNSDPNKIKISVKTSGILEINPTVVNISSKDGSVLLSDDNLYVYQQTNNREVKLEASFNILQENTYGYNIKNYDHTKLLTIDPIWVGFSTYLGGSGNDHINDIQIDSAGNIYVTGYTESGDFQEKNNAYAKQSIPEAFLTKISSTGNLVFSTYIGGNAWDEAYGLALDPNGDPVIVGETLSTNFPLTSPAQTDQGGYDAFVTKFSNTGTVSYSSYLGGSGTDKATSVVAPSPSYVVVVGSTYSSDFPTSFGNATYNAGSDIFAVRTKLDGTGLSWGTYIGGSGNDFGTDIAYDSVNDRYFITGYTSSTNLPTAATTIFSSSSGNNDVFVYKLGYYGPPVPKVHLDFMSYLGGSSNDYGYGIAVNVDGNVYVTGSTSSSNLYTKNAKDNTLTGTTDAFVSKINMATNQFIFSTYLGGISDETGWDIGIGNSDNAFIVGSTTSSNFPRLNSPITSIQGTQDLFVTQFNADGSLYLYSATYGGAGTDSANAIAVDNSNNAFVAGVTSSQDYTLVNPMDSTTNTNEEGFITEFVDEVDTDAPSLVSNYPNQSVAKSSNSMNLSPSDPTSLILSVKYGWDTTNPTTVLNFPYDIPFNSVEGTHTLRVRVTDSANNYQTFVFSYTTDDTPPTFTPVSTTVISGGANFYLSVNDLTLATVQYHWDSNTWQTIASPYQIFAPTSEGAHTFYVTARDGAGNSNTTSQIFTVDNSAPIINSPNDISYEYGSTTNEIQWSVIDLHSGSYRIYVDTVYDIINTWSNDTYVSFNVDGLSIGTHNITIVAFDVVGNSATDTVIVTVIATSLGTTTEPITTDGPITTSATQSTSDTLTQSNEKTTTDLLPAGSTNSRNTIDPLPFSVMYYIIAMLPIFAFSIKRQSKLKR